MKAIITRGATKFPIFHKPYFCAVNLHSNRPICCSSSSQNQKPQTPLFLRPPIYSATLSDLKKWHNWAKSLATSVGSSLVDFDNGPDSTLLLRELNWFIQDSFHVQDHHSFISQQLDSDSECEYTNDSKIVTVRVELEELYSLWKQRIEDRRPFQYIVGCEHWRDLVLCVEKGVLIPRPETELIVDFVSDVLLNDQELKNGLWADLGTGSGAIAIGIGRILGKFGRVIATDLSPVAVTVATFNVQRYALQDVIEVRRGSWFEPLMDVKGKLGGVVSNPPYIPSKQISCLQAEVGRHEPRLALDGGVNGMDDLLHICNGAASLLKPGGFFAFETNGEEQCKFLVEYMDKNMEGSFCNVNILSDFAGVPRFVTGFRQ